MDKIAITQGRYVIVDPLNIPEDKRCGCIAKIKAPERDGSYYCYTREQTTEQVSAIKAYSKESTGLAIYKEDLVDYRQLGKDEFLLAELDQDGEIMQISSRNDPSGECAAPDRNTGVVSIADRYHIEGILEK